MSFGTVSNGSDSKIGKADDSIDWTGIEFFLCVEFSSELELRILSIVEELPK